MNIRRIDAGDYRVAVNGHEFVLVQRHGQWVVRSSSLEWRCVASTKKEALDKIAAYMTA